MPDALRIQSGILIAHRLLDAADAIDLGRAEELWLSRDGRSGRRHRLQSVAPNELAFEAPPLSLALPGIELELDGARVAAQMTARLYDFGAIRLAVQLDVAELSWDQFVARCNAFDRALGSAAESPLWRAALDTVREAIGPALHRPSQRHLEEDYLFAIVHRSEPALSAAEFRERADLAALLAGDSRPLAPAQRAELTAHAYSYFADDLVVVTWDRAFILEPRRDTDVIDIIEVANAQLLEMRYYDELLDAELARMYDLVASTRGGLSPLASRRAARLARRLYGLVAEVTQLTEKVENTLQVTEDVYLARVYGAALELFRVPRLSAAVDRKLAIVRDTYSALYNEASSLRAELLEIAIVLLIVFEIVLALIERA
jgi:hypothetical protein